MSKEDLAKLTTETRNKSTFSLDKLSVLEVLKIMNAENDNVQSAISKVLPKIEAAIQMIVDSFNHDGRLIYMGAGTSGRLGVLDAAECVPTFGTSPDMVVGLIAGGERAMTKAVEGAEDDEKLGKNDLKDIKLSPLDTVVGVSASGRTPYVMGGLEYANQLGAKTIALSCNDESAISSLAKISIEVIVGPEILTGSTRLKAGTAQKLVLNMLSTVSMIQIGKVYQNLMIDINVTNEKLEDRATRIISNITEASYEQAHEALVASHFNVKNAVVMLAEKVSFEESQNLLQKADGFIYKIIEGEARKNE
ncbi:MULTISPECIES: N-acetylmuramic acid 6-phosphate etherase [Aerococcus]|uniref:N-acetylmuramic acid 6-phosphate etherase n=1 Tax=Aerococcus TaxID=1375 RepID=UPI000DCEC526|nr:MULTISPECIES: N-acetylmuramic acid 6-phosphate etherase [Aerococcus]KAA9296594.1 N-acetylmuramic acid 6-phosphate etherase [Aerococcus tenax]MDK6689526.1 N-acetylmuramic acid 6-phosphate etherase [Aerococcus urinae]MDK8132745.1 N-acetylmuramic acid 6-phosphate etherase [Aerococcus urinae]MDK8485566.1 N-acetylmuramic acid 6-phosphate etherase [Aerococcus urinae]MDL5179384.1 N-acetylmuramic acid 6-phosphate etherase [Aerococcus tenax]